MSGGVHGGTCISKRESARARKFLKNLFRSHQTGAWTHPVVLAFSRSCTLMHTNIHAYIHVCLHTYMHTSTYPDMEHDPTLASCCQREIKDRRIKQGKLDVVRTSMPGTVSHRPLTLLNWSHRPTLAHLICVVRCSRRMHTPSRPDLR